MSCKAEHNTPNRSTCVVAIEWILNTYELSIIHLETSCKAEHFKVSCKDMYINQQDPQNPCD